MEMTVQSNDYSNPILDAFYKDCSDITERYEKLWGRWELDSQLLHIVTEIAELKDVLRNKNSKYGKYASFEHMEKMRDELADVFLTTLATANWLGISVDDLNIALIKKLVIVENRVEELERSVSERRDD